MLPHPLTLSLNLAKYLKGNTEVCQKIHKHRGLKEKETDTGICLWRPLWLFPEWIHFPVAFIAVRAERTAGILQCGTHVAEHVLREFGEFRIVICARDENVEHLVIRVITGWSGSTVSIPIQHSLGGTVCLLKGKGTGQEETNFCSLFSFYSPSFLCHPLQQSFFALPGLTIPWQMIFVRLDNTFHASFE